MIRKILKATARIFLPARLRTRLRQLLINEPPKPDSTLIKKIDELKMLSARVLIRQIQQRGDIDDLREAEFKIFSQFGEDGIIQYLISKIGIRDETFIEFGVQDYAEANSRFLLMNNNWRGLIIDASEQYISLLKKSPIYWQYDITAVCSFIDKDNINKIISDSGFSGQVGLLSIDIDGNDYWIWKSLTVVNPVIVIVEYNSAFGNKYAITVPYDPLFERSKAHYSFLYWGSSLKALCLLAEKKGYCFVGSNSNGCNAFFVRKDSLGTIPAQTAKSGYVKSKIRESRGRDGRLSFVGGDERIKIIQDMTVYDLETGREVRIKDLGELVQ